MIVPRGNASLNIPDLSLLVMTPVFLPCMQCPFVDFLPLKGALLDTLGGMGGRYVFGSTATPSQQARYIRRPAHQRGFIAKPKRFDSSSKSADMT